jgi:hypothetical protein
MARNLAPVFCFTTEDTGDTEENRRSVRGTTRDACPEPAPLRARTLQCKVLAMTTLTQDGFLAGGPDGPRPEEAGVTRFVPAQPFLHGGRILFS